MRNHLANTLALALASLEGVLMEFGVEPDQQTGFTGLPRAQEHALARAKATAGAIQDALLMNAKTVETEEDETNILAREEI